MTRDERIDPREMLAALNAMARHTVTLDNKEVRLLGAIEEAVNAHHDAQFSKSTQIYIRDTYNAFKRALHELAKETVISMRPGAEPPAQYESPLEDARLGVMLQYRQLAVIVGPSKLPSEDLLKGPGLTAMIGAIDTDVRHHEDAAAHRIRRIGEGRATRANAVHRGVTDFKGMFTDLVDRPPDENESAPKR